MKYWITLAMALLPSISTAHEWFTIKDFPTIRTATPKEVIDFKSYISEKLISYDFDKGEILIHDGDLHIPGSYSASGLLIVRGNLTVNGMYDDYTGTLGITAVEGNMFAENIYSGASLYVQGDLNVSNLLMTIYNDFSLEVSGRLNTKGLIIYDKVARFIPGDISFAFVEKEDEVFSDLRINTGIRKLQPELISSPNFRDPIYESEDISNLRADYNIIRLRLDKNQPILREMIAPADLPIWVNKVLNMETSDAELLTLINKDPLVNQLMAARFGLSATLISKLKETADPIVIAWLDTRKSL
jgi:hypothetical protein